MGGNALKNAVTRRYASAEYLNLKDRVLSRVREHVSECDVPKEFPGKESFGDLDVLMVCPTSLNVQTLIEDLFHPTEIVHNGDVFSFDFEQFQVDFILVTKEQFQNATVYFSYSDLGGLIGNICHKIGLKYGIQGLWMNVHTKEFDPTTTSTKLVLSTNPHEIFDFLGHNYDRYVDGFNSENDFFQWIIEGKYFRPSYFDDDQLNHAHRQRTHKRPVYIKFKSYLQEQQEAKQHENQSCEDHEQFSCAVRQQALVYFNKQEVYDEGFVQREQRRQFREKYNGRFFCDIDVAKNLIPIHMKNFERRFADTDEEFHRWVLNTDQEQIKTEIELFKRQLKQSSSS